MIVTVCAVGGEMTCSCGILEENGEGVGTSDEIHVAKLATFYMDGETRFADIYDHCLFVFVFGKKVEGFFGDE